MRNFLEGALMTKAVEAKPAREYVATIIHYDPYTGSFTRLIWGRWKSTQPVAAGSVKRDCYTRIQIGQKIYQGSNIAWLLMTGEWPSAMVDHKDGNPRNNRWSNLRLATNSTNRANSRTGKNNRLGIKGVRLHRNGQFEARLRKDGRAIYLGCYPTLDAAQQAYAAAAHAAFGDFSRLS
jgi:hypothetical protein